MKNNFIKIWCISAVLAFVILSAFFVIRIYIIGYSHKTDYMAIFSVNFSSEEALIDRLQQQNLWVDLQNINYQQTHVAPPIAYKYIPNVIENISQPQLLKNSFVSIMLPLVLIANEEIKAEQKFVTAMRGKGGKLNLREAQSLKDLARRYRCKKRYYACLELRIQPVPVALAIGQAAVESGWGTSRFARQGHALFGQWTNEQARKYIAALESREEGVVRLRAFDHILDSVRSYMLNLNTHRAYREFRSGRLQYMKEDLSFLQLLETLERYAEKDDYARILLQVIQNNNLSYFNTAELGSVER